MCQCGVFPAYGVQHNQIGKLRLYRKMRKKKQVNRLISSVIFSLVALSALSQTAANGRPTLVVGITIDQLRSDYIQLLQSHFGENGFKRLLREGVYIENAVFKIADVNKITSTALRYSMIRNTSAMPQTRRILLWR